MLITYYTTSDPTLLAKNDELELLEAQWRVELLQLVKELGFTDCRCHSFGAPAVFITPRPKGVWEAPVLKYFTKGRQGQSQDGPTFEYELKTLRSAGSIRDKLDEFGAKWKQPEQQFDRETGEAWDMRTVGCILAKRIGVYKRVFTDAGWNSQSIQSLESEEYGRTLVLTAPIGRDSNERYEQPVEVGPEWTAVPTYVYALLLNAHNAKYATPKSEEESDDNDEWES